MARFERSELERLASDARTLRCNELAQWLTARKSELPFDRRVTLLVAELRELGHDLWSFDESDEFAIWAPNWHTPAGPGIVVTFTPDAVTVEWTDR